MICCTTKAKAQDENKVVKRNSKLLIEFCGEVNDEGLTLVSSPTPFNKNASFKYCGENSMIKTGSNRRIERSVDRLANGLPCLTPKKTSFSSFSNNSTNQRTKFLSAKDGFVLLLTKVADQL